MFHLKHSDRRAEGIESERAKKRERIPAVTSASVKPSNLFTHSRKQKKKCVNRLLGFKLNKLKFLNIYINI